MQFFLGPVMRGATGSTVGFWAEKSTFAAGEAVRKGVVKLIASPGARAYVLVFTEAVQPMVRMAMFMLLSLRCGFFQLSRNAAYRTDGFIQPCTPSTNLIRP